MIHFGKSIVKLKIPIFIISLLLLIPATLGYINTRVNYDILSYLPKDIETMKGQDILEEDFGSGAFALLVVEGMPEKDVAALQKKIEKVEHVKSAVWYSSIADTSIPMKLLPDKLYKKFNNGDATLMMVIFDETTSSEGTLGAIKEIRSISDKNCFLSGMSCVVSDTRDLTNKETPVYVAIAVILSSIILAFTMDSFLVPVFFLLSIGMAIIYNLGSNIMFGEISYITKALSAVLQLGVTMDYSIFLWNSFKENQQRFPGDNNRAMAHAISNTLVSVLGSSITTVAGFIALCFMSFTLGLDIGLVMAKGVIFGVLACVTILPSMVLIFEKAIEKTKHRPLLPEFHGIGKLIEKKYFVFIALFLIILIPALYGYRNTKNYYDLADTLPKDLPCSMANTRLHENFDIATTHMVLVDSKLESKKVSQMCNDIKKVDGVSYVLGLDSLKEPGIPVEILPHDVVEKLQSDNWKLILIGTSYGVATDEVNAQCTDINNIVKAYDNNGMLIGEAPCTKDLIDITNKDFATVNLVSVGLVFIIILIVFKSISLPVILVSAIEFAIFINMGIPYYTNTSIPFIASIVIGTIQLGATVDYAILMTTRYLKERNKGADKKTSIRIASETCTKSVIISALSFFAATFGVGLYSKVDIISSLCSLMARGAIVSMITVIFILPSLLMVFDKIIVHTSLGVKADN
ncbi:MAG: efflux RND transporter permease subunit [Catonella sp.]